MIRKYSATLHGHRTSFSLEPAFHDELKAIAAERAMPLAALIREIDDQPCTTSTQTTSSAQPDPSLGQQCAESTAQSEFAPLFP